MKCSELHITPSSVVINGIEREKLNLAHSGLRQKGGIAFGACLAVRSLPNSGTVLLMSY